MQMEYIVGGLAAVIVLLYQLHKQLILIRNNLPNSIKNYNEKNFSVDDEIGKGQAENKVYDGKYNKSLDYTDRLAEWVKASSDKGIFICRAKCNKLSGFSLSCDAKYFVNEVKQKEKNKDNNNIKKKYYLSFDGVMKSYYGYLPSMESVCDFSFIIHFEENVEKGTSNVWVGQDLYNDVIDDIKYYEGKHTVTLEFYEDISEFEKYNALLCSGKNLGAEVSFEIDVSKIKMNENMIDNTYVSHVGKLSWFTIYAYE